MAWQKDLKRWYGIGKIKVQVSSGFQSAPDVICQQAVERPRQLCQGVIEIEVGRKYYD